MLSLHIVEIDASAMVGALALRIAEGQEAAGAFLTGRSSGAV